MVHFWRILGVSLALLTLQSGVVSAEDRVIPKRHFALFNATDFPGGDLRSIFNTTLDACQRACVLDASCFAFTFNTRNGSCFPKGATGEGVFFDGAVSGLVLPATEQAEALAKMRLAELPFVGAWDYPQITEQAAMIGNQSFIDGYTAEEHRLSANLAEGDGNPVYASQFMAAVVTLTDLSEDWAEYARLSLAASGTEGVDQTQFLIQSYNAAVNAYIRAENEPSQHNALVAMAMAFEPLGRGTDMVKALRLAQTLQPRDETAQILDSAADQYGFRVADHVVLNNLSSPKVCVNFSDLLVKSGADYESYVQLPEPDLTVTTDGWQQLCVEGLEFGSRAQFTLREGLPAADGQTLTKSVTISAYVRDRSPGVRFVGRGYVLPQGSAPAIPVQTVNTTKLDVELFRVTDRNLMRSIQNGYLDTPIAEWQEYDFENQVSAQLWAGTAEVGQEVNRDITTRLPLSDALNGRAAGIYALKASVPGADPYTSPAAWQWFVVSDIGLTTLSGVDGLHVFARALGSAQPKAGVDIELVSRANEVLAKAVTDETGYARFDPALTLGKGGASAALIVARAGQEDLAFLSLTEPEFDLSDRGVEGREAAPPIDVFLSTDRGAYRAGETVYATALARDPKGDALQGLPLTAILTRPDGVEYARQIVKDSLGGYVFALPLAGNAPRGIWTYQVFADLDADALGTGKFLVEDFLPERIEVSQKLATGPVRLGDRPLLDLSAQYLFGAPGAGLKVEGEVLLRKAAEVEGWADFAFGLQDSDFSATMQSFDTTTTDAQGLAQISLLMPPVDDPGLPLEIRVTTRVAEGSGRPVERQLTQLLAPSHTMIGVKSQFGSVAKDGDDARFTVVAIRPDLKEQALGIRWTASRLDTQYQWYQIDGNWNWEPVTRRETVAEGQMDLIAGTNEIAVPVTAGSYELRVEEVNTTGASKGAATSVLFHAGWYAPADVTTTPDTLDVSLDKEAYLPGDTAKLRILARSAGTGLVTVASNRLIAMTAVTLTQGENLIDLPVTEEWGSGAYVTTALYRPMDAAAGRNPARSLGLAHAKVDPGKRRLATSIDLPDRADPRGPLPIAVKLDGLAEGELAYVTIAAVDQGILNLTGFASPDPLAHYFGQRKLGLGIRDIYGRLIDGLNGAEGRLRSGGDAGAQARLQAPPPTEELVAYFTGPVQVGADGMARVSFDLPAFNGRVKVMAIAWTATSIGQAEAEVQVSDPVVVTASLPRFMAPGDQSRLLLEIVHAEGAFGRMGLDVTAKGAVLGSVPSGFDLTEKGAQSIEIDLTAGDPGLATLEVVVTTPDGKALTKSLSLPIQRNDAPVVSVSRLELAKGQSFTFDQAAFDGLDPQSSKAILAVGPIARLNAPGLLAALDAYPYGCTEQITAKAMPLLYFDQISKALDLHPADDIGSRIQQSITEVLANQAATGGFGLWGPQSGDMWLDAFVTDFLSRAKAQGHPVPDLAFRMALDNLRNQVNYHPDFDYGGEALAYGLMVLAREGAAAIGDLRYYADVKGDAFATPTAMAQLGAALTAYGDQPRADAMFARAAVAIDALPSGAAEQVYRVDFGTDTRDAAAVLALASEARSFAVDAEKITARLTAVPAMSTQEATWTLLAAHALLDRQSSDGLLVDGKPMETGGVLKRTGTDSAPIQITNTGADTFITLTTIGQSSEPQPAQGNGYAITRTYHHMDGTLADMSRIKRGDRLITVLEISPYGRGEARLMVNDPLPAGFEIDNPNLMSSGTVTGLDWLQTENEVAHAEFRQDRFLTAIDRRDNASFRLAYQVRAISPGTFAHPAPSVEDMYRPDLTGRGEQGRLTISP